MEQPQIFTLKQVALSIQKSISERYSQTYWVVAEVHKLNRTNKGHCYPELVQKEGDEIIVQMKGTIWKQKFELIQQKFHAVVKEPLRDGMQLLLLVKIGYSPLYNIALDIQDIDANYTIGSLQKERQETLNRLQKEGILNRNQQVSMAMLPKRLAVISQKDSKGYLDFVTLINGHEKRYHFDTFLFEATLQGDAAIASIQSQLERIKSIQHLFDAVVVIRGGGGEIGMHCYNNFELAKSIATFPLPVLAGIGHATNLTVCEMISYYNGITPSDLAYYLLRIMESLDLPLDEALQKIPEQIKRILSDKSIFLNHSHELIGRISDKILRVEYNTLQSTIKLLETQTKQHMVSSNQRFSLLQQNFAFSTKNATTTASNILQFTTQSISIVANNSIQPNINHLNRTVDLIKNGVEKVMLQSQQLLNQHELHIRMADPQNIINKGYALVRNDQGILSGSNLAKKGDQISIELKDQTFDARVE